MIKMEYSGIFIVEFIIYFKYQIIQQKRQVESLPFESSNKNKITLEEASDLLHSSDRPQVDNSKCRW